MRNSYLGQYINKKNKKGNEKKEIVDTETGTTWMCCWWLEYNCYGKQKCQKKTFLKQNFSFSTTYCQLFHKGQVM